MGVLQHSMQQLRMGPLKTTITTAQRRLVPTGLEVLRQHAEGIAFQGTEACADAALAGVLQHCYDCFSNGMHQHMHSSCMQLSRHFAAAASSAASAQAIAAKCLLTCMQRQQLHVRLSTLTATPSSSAAQC